MSDPLDPDAAGEVLRRAAELDLERGGDGRGLDRSTLEAAADEVGLSSDAVRRALAEHDAGALAPTPPERSLLGPARVRLVRTIDLPPRSARQRVDRWLKSQLLEVHRRGPTETEWRRRDDLGAKVRRRVDPTKRVRLSGVDGVVASVVDDGTGRSVVRLEGLLEFTRNGLRTLSLIHI